MKKLFALALLASAVACGGYDDSVYDAAGSEIGQVEQAYTLVKPVGSMTRMLGTRPLSNSNSSNIACRNGQATSTDCRFVIAASQNAGFYVFVNVGIDEASLSPGQAGQNELSQLNQDLDFVLNELIVDFPGSPGGTQSRYQFTHTSYADSSIAFRKAAIGSVLTASTTDVYKFMNVEFHGCSGNIPEQTAYPGTWKACSSGIVNLDIADFIFLPSAGGAPAASKRRQLMAAGILSALGFGLQGVRDNQKNYTSITQASATQSNYWGPIDYATNPTRCVADWTCFGALQSGAGAASRCDGVQSTVKMYDSISTCSGID